MGNACKPPKCKNCGKEEWRHVCFQGDAAKARVKEIEKRASPKARAAAEKKRSGKPA